MRGPRTWLVVAGILVASAYAVPGFAVADVASIRLTDTFRFEPADVTVLVNTTVRWQNAGTTAWHTVTAYEDDLPEGDAYFDSSGAENETAARQAPPEGYLRPGDV